MSALMLVSCNKSGKPAALPDGLAGVRAAIVSRNYAEAADLARKEVASHPREAAAQFELARAEALLGNEGRALDALDAAITAGLPDAARALQDPAFAAMSGSDRFAALAERASPAPAAHSGQAALSAGSGAGRGADRVEIHEGAGGTHIQAGDIKLDTDF